MTRQSKFELAAKISEVARDVQTDIEQYYASVEEMMLDGAEASKETLQQLLSEITIIRETVEFFTNDN